MALRALVVLLLAVACSAPPSVAPSSAASPSVAAPAVTRTGAPTPTPGPVLPTPPRDDATPRSFTRLALDSGQHDGTTHTSQGLTLGPTPARGSYTDPHSGRTIADERGTWTSSLITPAFEFEDLIASWNGTTPPGTWIDVQMRATGRGRSTKWYTLAVWASGDETIRRTTVRGQDDGDGRVNVDTFERRRESLPLSQYELRVTLHRTPGAASPIVRLLTAVVTAPGDHDIMLGPDRTVRDLDVPTLSQETHAGHYPDYDGGGEAWCSPTSTAMVLAFWKSGPSGADLAAFPGAGHADGAVDHAARYTYDWSYRGAGNWPYNTAYAAGYGLESFVTRLRSLVEAERFIAAGIPLVASITGTLPGFLFASTEGHLLVIRGFEADGDVIVNDPAVRANGQARKVYPRLEFEGVWLRGSKGTVYVIRPPSVPLPPNTPGRPANW